jgi:autotransporter family porin
LTLMGDVLHNGATINTLTGATTVFQGAVSGAGNFSGGGNVDFEKSYAPGNSPAAINFGGDNVTFGTNSTLSMDIFGANPGQQYDQLLNIGKLDFEGQLKLNFANYSPDVAMIFTLFDYKSFSGSFDSARIFVGGIDKSRLDFSQLALNGELSVRAIPIPPSFIFLASGLAVMLTSNLRRKGLVRIDGPDLLA